MQRTWYDRKTRRVRDKSCGDVRIYLDLEIRRAFCRPENKAALGYVEGFNNKIRVLQRRAYGLRDEEYLRLKVLTCTLPEI